MLCKNMPLTLDLIADLARAFDDDDAFQAGPIVYLLCRPFDIMNDSYLTSFYPAVIAIDGLVAADFGVLEVDRFLFIDVGLDIVFECALIAFQGEE